MRVFKTRVPNAQPYRTNMLSPWYSNSQSLRFIMCPYHCTGKIGKIISSLVNCYLKNQCLPDTQIKLQHSSFSSLLQVLLQIALYIGRSSKDWQYQNWWMFSNKWPQENTILTRNCNILCGIKNNKLGGALASLYEVLCFEQKPFTKSQKLFTKFSETIH